MKKSLLLLVAGALTLTAGAQSAKQMGNLVRGYNANDLKKVVPSQTGNAVARRHSAERTTATCFYTETFSSGTYATLPTGWTAAILSGPGTWHWANQPSPAMYSIGAIASTTASD